MLYFMLCCDVEVKFKRELLRAALHCGEIPKNICLIVCMSRI